MRSPPHFPLRPSRDPVERWPHLELPFIGNIALGNVTQWQFMIGWCEGSETLHVAILGKGYCDFAQRVDPSIIAESFSGIPLADCCNVADLVNAQFGYNTNHGLYELELCREEA